MVVVLPTTPIAAAMGSILLVVGDAARPTAGETAVLDHLESAGHAVTVMADETATRAEAALHDLVWITADVSLAALDDGLAASTTPVVVTKPWLFDDFGLTPSPVGNYGSTSVAAITITAPDDPTAAGFEGSVALTGDSSVVSTGTPTAGATVVATADGAATVFRVDPGATLADGTNAPACRLSFPAFKNHPTWFSDDAWTLLDATVAHGITNCIAEPPDDQPPAVDITAPADGAVIGGTVAVQVEATDDDAVAHVTVLADDVPVGTDGDAGDGWRVDLDTTTLADGALSLTAVATDTAGQSTTSEAVVVIVDNSSAEGSSVLVVVADAAAPTAGEAAISDRLAARGYAVTMMSDETVGPAHAAAHDLVWISSDVALAAVNDDLPAVATPIVVAKPWLFDDFGLTPAAAGSYGVDAVSSVEIADPSDPTAGGLGGSVALTAGRVRVSVGVPASAARVVATADGAATIWHVDADAPLANGTTAAACRLTFPAFRDAPADFGADAWTLVDATVSHGLSDCTLPPFTREPLLFGMTPGPGRAEDLLEVEELLGRRLDLVRLFERWDSPPDPYHQQVLDGDRVMVLSVRAQRLDGTPISWRAIADAPVGSPLHQDMVAWAQYVASLDGEILFSFNHEPEATINLDNGDAQDYVDAWRRMHDVFASEGASVRWTWIMTAYSFRLPPNERRHAPSWYPGDDVVEVIGADAYNWFGCLSGNTGTWRSLSWIVDGFGEFGREHPDEDLLLAEWASTEGAPGQKAAWIEEAAEMMLGPAWDRLIGVSYFNSGSQARCTWSITSSASALEAIQEVADRSDFGGAG